MKDINKTTIYLDTGALSHLLGNPALEDSCILIFSRALLLDLKNSTMSRLIELEYLKKQNAFFAQENLTGVNIFHLDPFEAYEQCDSLETRAMAPLISLLNGGGPDTGFEGVLTRVLEELGINIDVPSEGTNDGINRRMGQGIDKLKHKLGPKFNLQKTIAALPAEGQEALNTVFPPGAPTFDQLKYAAITLSLMGIQSKYIQSRTAEKSLKVARHDQIDSEHIAYGLHFNAFISTDDITTVKAAILRDYWQIDSEIWYFDTKTRKLKKV